MGTNISDILQAPWTNGVIATAIKLNVFSIIADKELTVDDVAAACQAIPQRLKPLLDACVSLGILEIDHRQYRNSHFSSVYLVEGNQNYVGDFIKVINYESLQWFQLPDVITGKEKENAELSCLRTDTNTFIAAMNCIGHLGEAKALKEVVDLTGCKQMTDAGGGSGIYSLALCRKYPDLYSTILDRRDTLAVTAEFISNQTEGNRITLREGNFLKDPLGENVDAVLLSDVMYRESEAKIILKNAWQSLRPNGMLIIRGYYADPEGSDPLFGALFAVKLMVDDPHRKVMSFPGLKKIAREAGFKIISALPLTERSYVLIGRK